MSFETILQKIIFIFLVMVMGIIAPWWVVIPVAMSAIFLDEIGPEILIATVFLDLVLRGSVFALWYSYALFATYLIYLLGKRILFR